MKSSRLSLLLGMAPVVVAMACGSSDDHAPPPGAQGSGGELSSSSGGSDSGGSAQSGGGVKDDAGNGAGGVSDDVDGGAAAGAGGTGASTGGAAAGGQAGAGAGGVPAVVPCTLTTKITACDGCIVDTCNTECRTCEGDAACKSTFDCIVNGCIKDGILDLTCANTCRQNEQYQSGQVDFGTMLGACGTTCSGFCSILPSN